MAIVACFDSNIVGWAIRGDATSGQEDNILKARALFKTCKEKNIKILIPAIAFGEVLCPISLEQQKDFGLVMMKEYLITPFDAQCAMEFSKLWKEKSDSQKEEVSRKMKPDYMILATAIAKKAEVLYTEDRKLQRFAGDYIRTEGLPGYTVQTSLDI